MYAVIVILYLLIDLIEHQQKNKIKLAEIDCPFLILNFHSIAHLWMVGLAISLCARVTN